MCGFVGKLLSKVFGGGDTPVIIRESPVADADRADAEAAAKAVKARRRRGAASLLATGGAGDTSNPVTGIASATPGKTTLGA